MTAWDEARRVQEEHVGAMCCHACEADPLGPMHVDFPCPLRRLADEVCRLSALAEKVPHMKRFSGYTHELIGPVTEHHATDACPRCAFASPAKGGEGDRAAQGGTG